VQLARLAGEAGAAEQPNSIRGNVPTVAVSTPVGRPKDQESELLQSRLDKMIVDQSLNVRKDLEASIGGVLREHREYLQKLDEKFYDRFSVWVPILSILGSIIAAVGVVVVGVAVWHFDKTRKDALDSFKSEVTARLDTIAREKVNEIVTAENLRAQLSVVIQKTTGKLIKKAEQQINDAQNRFVKDNLAAVIEALEQSQPEMFSKHIDILTRVEQLQLKLADLESQLAGLNSINWGALVSPA